MVVVGGGILCSCELDMDEKYDYILLWVGLVDVSWLLLSFVCLDMEDMWLGVGDEVDGIWYILENVFLVLEDLGGFF